MPDKKKFATKPRKFKNTTAKVKEKPKTRSAKKTVKPTPKPEQEVVEIMALEKTASVTEISVQTPVSEEKPEEAPKISPEMVAPNPPTEPENEMGNVPLDTSKMIETENVQEKEEREVKTDAEETKDTVEEEEDNGDVTVVEEGGLRWLLILIILFLVGLIGGLFFLFLSQNKTDHKAATPSSTLKTVKVYTPSPTLASVAKDSYTIKVLNGSGVAGEAAANETFLNGKGYKVTGTGNADNSNYTKTEIEAKSSVSAGFLSELEQDLGTKYTVDTSTSTLDDSTTEDVDVIIGSTTK